MKVKPISELIDFCQTFATPLELKVVDAEFKQGKEPSLTIFIDSEKGIDLDLCEKFHRAIYEPIDEFDPTFGEPYTLNVSSLGADRPFKSDYDFESHINKKVEVKLKNAIKSSKFYDGILLKYDGKSIVIKTDKGETLSIELKSIVKVNEYIEF